MCIYATHVVSKRLFEIDQAYERLYQTGLGNAASQDRRVDPASQFWARADLKLDFLHNLKLATPIDTEDIEKAFIPHSFATILFPMLKI